MKHLIRISQANLLKSASSVDEEFKKEVDFILSLLPKQTVVKSVEVRDMVTSISRDFLVTFEHPTFKENTKIELDYKREAWAENGKIVEATVLTSYRLIDA